MQKHLAQIGQIQGTIQGQPHLEVKRDKIKQPDQGSGHDRAVGKELKREQRRRGLELLVGDKAHLQDADIRFSDLRDNCRTNSQESVDLT